MMNHKKMRKNINDVNFHDIAVNKIEIDFLSDTFIFSIFTDKEGKLGYLIFEGVEKIILPQMIKWDAFEILKVELSNSINDKKDINFWISLGFDFENAQISFSFSDFYIKGYTPTSVIG